MLFPSRENHLLTFILNWQLNGTLRKMSILQLTTSPAPAPRSGGSASRPGTSGQLISTVGARGATDALGASTFAVRDRAMPFQNRANHSVTFIRNWWRNGILPRMSTLQHTTDPGPASRSGGNALPLMITSGRFRQIPEQARRRAGALVAVNLLDNCQ